MGWLAAIVLPVIVLIAVAGTSKHLWVQLLVGGVLFVSSTIFCIWALIIGWALAVIGLLMLICGIVWKLVSNSNAASPYAVFEMTHPSGGLIWPGLGLLGAPFANVFVLMPSLRPFFT